MSNSFMTPWTVTQKAPLSMGFSRQEYSSESPFPSPGDLPDPGIKTSSPALVGGFFTTEPPREPSRLITSSLFFFKIVLAFCFDFPYEA